MEDSGQRVASDERQLHQVFRSSKRDEYDQFFDMDSIFGEVPWYKNSDAVIVCSCPAPDIKQGFRRDRGICRDSIALQMILWLHGDSVRLKKMACEIATITTTVFGRCPQRQHFKFYKPPSVAGKHVPLKELADRSGSTRM